MITTINMSSTDSKRSYLKRDEIVGKSVVSAEGMILGTAADLVASSEGKVGLSVEPKPGTTGEMIIPPDEILAIGDLILLKPKGQVTEIWRKTQPSTPPPFPSGGTDLKNCSRCGYLNGSTSRFCIKCGNSIA